MDEVRARFLFGDIPNSDPSDPDELLELLRRQEPDLGSAALGVRAAVATQVLTDDPPEAWQTAARLLDLGLAADDVLRQLVLTFTPQVIAALHEQPFDLQGYLAALERLPLPDAATARRALLTAVQAEGVAPLEGVLSVAAVSLGLADDQVGEALLDAALDSLLDEPSQAQLLAGDIVVDVPRLLEHVVLTHDSGSEVCPTGIDLVAFRHLLDHPVDTLPPRGVLALRVRDGGLEAVPLEAEPDVDPALVERLRRAYDVAVAEPGLPVPVEELVLAVTAHDPDSFATAQAPLRRLLAEAGLEVRGDAVAHEASVWQRHEDFAETRRLEQRLDPDTFDTVLSVMGLLEQEVDVLAGRAALEDLQDPEVLEAVAHLLLGNERDDDRLASARARVQRLAATVSRPAQRAVVQWLSSVVAERAGALEEAESLLRDAVRQAPGWPPAVDRLAWYRSDRGDAAGALDLWQQLGLGEQDDDDVRTLLALPAGTARVLGRNDRCWCGSGRKFKQCHLGRPEALPLPERIAWLMRKSVGFLERRAGLTGDDVYDAVVARATDPDDEASARAAVDDPLVLDVVLHEGGWFAQFVEERGELLPEDELLLAQAWLLVDRAVYDVEQTRPGQGVTVRDLRTGDVIEVREKTFSRTARVGMRVCARAVPGGELHQFAGGIFRVAPGTEGQVLELLDDGDGVELLGHVADLHRPPVVVGPGGHRVQVGSAPSRASTPLPPVDAGTAEQVMQHLEHRWCTEPVPALGGLTPEQAAQDPTRRDDVVRLIASFPTPDPSTGALGLRPQALRDRLGLT